MIPIFSKRQSTTKALWNLTTKMSTMRLNWHYNKNWVAYGTDLVAFIEHNEGFLLRFELFLHFFHLDRTGLNLLIGFDQLRLKNR